MIPLGGALSVAPDEAIAAFELCEQILGRQWIAEVVAGDLSALKVLSIVSTGQRLTLLDGLSGTQELLTKIGRHDASAHAELHAISLLSSGGETEVDLYPPVAVGRHRRVPDFRVRQGGGEWTYVEVTKADVSGVAAAAQLLVVSLANVANDIDASASLEVFLRREPSDAELRVLPAQMLEFCAKLNVEREELPGGYGVLVRSQFDPGTVVVTDHPGEAICPRMGAATTVLREGTPVAHISVRMPFSDQRAESFITAEAKQLPKGAPGLIMIETTQAASAFNAWEALIRRRFQPTLHTRVAGVCLFSQSFVLAEDGSGFASTSPTKMMTNPHAAMPLPPWVEPILT